MRCDAAKRRQKVPRRGKPSGYGSPNVSISLTTLLSLGLRCRNEGRRSGLPKPRCAKVC